MLFASCSNSTLYNKCSGMFLVEGTMDFISDPINGKSTVMIKNNKGMMVEGSMFANKLPDTMKVSHTILDVSLIKK